MWSLAAEILNWAKSNVLSLSAVHLKVELNQVAGFLSQKRLKEGDWRLNQEVMKMITWKWRVPQVDLFASRGNAKVRSFFSLEKGDGILEWML